MKKIFVIIFFILALLGIYTYRNELFSWLNSFSQNFSEIEKFSTVLLEPQKFVASLPPPLHAQKESPASTLTLAGVLKYANEMRKQNGLKPLKEDAELDRAALSKVDDMFAKQYFAHNSPDGKAAGDFAKEARYDFIALGENLALGNFKDDEALVQAWMESPGHRANILDKKFEELGVALRREKFEGKETWLAVQIFARPASSCPIPRLSDKAQIDALKKRAKELEAELLQMKTELEKMYENREPLYNEKAKEYNALVENYYKLIDESKATIDKYNAQVASYNLCLES